MKKFLAACLVLVITTTITYIMLTKQKPIKFCALPSYAPFVIIDKDNRIIGGFDVDLAKAMCKGMGTECKFILQQKRTQLLESLNSGKCDAWISCFTISPDRKKHMEFTKSYYPSSASLIAAKTSTFTAKNKALKDKRIGVTAGSNFITYLKITHGYDITIVEFNNIHDALDALKTNKVDGVISDTPLLQYWMQQKDNKDFQLIDLPEYNKEFSIGRGYGMPVKKGNVKLVTALNKALANVKADGTYDKLVKEYFSSK
jgi:ABC-type amino acid transport substrate-binding protein